MRSAEFVISQGIYKNCCSDIVNILNNRQLCTQHET